MSAHDYLMGALEYLQQPGDWYLSDNGATVQWALDMHANELAEKIRAELPERVEHLGPFTLTTVPTASQAADLIDPEVGNG